VYKPVASGVSNQNSSTESGIDRLPSWDAEPLSDPVLLCSAAGFDSSMLSRVCPQMFTAPLAPPSAAALEGKTVDEVLIVEGAQWWLERCRFLIVEGAGGVMSPIGNSTTCLDLAMELQFPVVLVAANRLGCVSQVLLCAEAIQRRGLTLMAVILNSMKPTDPLSTEGAASEAPRPLPKTPGRNNNLSEASDIWQEWTAQSSEQLIRNFLPNVPLMDDAKCLLELKLFQQ